MGTVLMLGLGASAAGIESANVVGYNHNMLTNGATMVAPMFLNMGTNGAFRLSDLTVAGYTAGECAGDVTIQMLDKNGNSVKDTNGKSIVYYWQDNPDYATVGWYDGNDAAVDADKVVFDAGEGLWVAAINGAYLTCAGQVGTADIAVALRAGATATGNMMPYTMKLSQITVSGYAAGECAGDVTIQTLDKNGNAIKDSNGKSIIYYWQDNPDYVTVGWYDGSDNAIDGTTITFAPGAGLWVSGIAGTYLNFPAPTL